jgi:Neprosin
MVLICAIRAAVISRRLGKSATVLVVSALLLPLIGCDSNEPDTITNRAALSTPGDALEQARVAAYIDSQYSSPDVRHSFRTRFGEDIDCVDFFKQPAFRNGAKPPATIPTRRVSPAGPSRAISPIVSSINDGSMDENGQQRLCPADSVPIVRVSPDRIAGVGGLDKFLLAHGKSQLPPGPGSSPPPSVAGFKYGLGIDNSYPSGSWLFDSTMSVYNPSIAAGTVDHSISQIWLRSPGVVEPCSGTACVQTLEAGWNVDSNLYGDSSTHFFIYSTQDGYQTTGCYNLETSCFNGGSIVSSGSGFVMAPGAAFTPSQIISTATVGFPNPDEFELGWESGVDPASNERVWYLWVNFEYEIGWIPAVYFDLGTGGGNAPMIDSFSFGQAGGEVYDSAPGGHDTTADMGSGQFAARGAWEAAYHRNVVYAGPTGGLVDSPGDPNPPIQTNPSEYTVSSAPPPGGSATLWRTYFYYGGPGLTSPAAPTGLIATASGGRVNLGWNNVSLADSYTVRRRSTKSRGQYSTLKTGIVPTYYQDSTGKKGTEYDYVVAAVNSLGTSPNSGQSSATP